MVLALSRRHYYWDKQELVSAGSVGYAMALATYNPGPVPFDAWATFKVRSAMIDAIRKWNQFQRHSPEQFQLVPLDRAGDRLLSDTLSNETRAVYRLLYQAVEALPFRERFIIRGYFFHNIPLKSLGESLDLTESRVHQLRGEGLRLLRQHLGVLDVVTTRVSVHNRRATSTVPRKVRPHRAGRDRQRSLQVQGSGDSQGPSEAQDHRQ